MDHGELSKAPKHIIIDKHHKPCLVDFETASVNRKPANVTSVCQFLFIGSGTVSKAVSKVLGEINRDEAITALRHYKNEKTHRNFIRLVKVFLS